MANGNDTQQVSVALVQAVKPEGDPGEQNTRFDFVVTRSGKTDSVLEVDWELRVAGTDPAEVNDLAAGQATAGTVEFAPDVQNQIVSVLIAGDIAVESDEYFTLALVGNDLPPGTTLGKTASAMATISNDDPTVTISPSLAQAFDEGNPGGVPATFSYTLTREGDLSEELTVSWAVAPLGDSPVDGTDFTGGNLPQGQVTFPIDSAQGDGPISFQAMVDSNFEPDEQFEVALSLPENAPAGTILGLDKVSGRILNDDAPPPELSIEATDADKPEGNTGDAPATEFTFTVTRTGDTNVESTVTWTATPNTTDGVSADDFVFEQVKTDTLTFPAGDTSPQEITLLVQGDTTPEPAEGFMVTLSEAHNATIVQATATGTIENDDAEGPPPPVVSIEDLSQAEGNTGRNDFTFTVSRTGDLSEAVTVNWAVGAGTPDSRHCDDSRGPGEHRSACAGAG